MISRCDSCRGTEFEIESFELVRRTFDSADIENPWSQSEPLEEDYIVSVHRMDCDKEYPPDTFGLSLENLEERLRKIKQENRSRIALFPNL